MREKACELVVFVVVVVVAAVSYKCWLHVLPCQCIGVFSVWVVCTCGLYEVSKVVHNSSVVLIVVIGLASADRRKRRYC